MAFAAAAIRTVGHHLDDVHHRVHEFATATVEHRVACALDRLVRRAGRQVDDGVVIDFPITRQEITELTGTTIATVSRILAAWHRQGLVADGRQRIIVGRPEDLARFGDDTST